MIGNSLASKPMLLRSALPLACNAELSGKTLRNLPRHASDACTANPLAGTIFLPCAAHIPVPAPRGLPHPPAAPSLCTAVLVHLCGQPCGHSMTHRNLLPVRRGTPAVLPPLSQRSCCRAPSLQQPSVNTVETPENSSHALTDHTRATRPESSCLEVLLYYL